MQYQDILYNPNLPSDVKYLIFDKLGPKDLVKEVNKRKINTRDDNFIRYLKKRIEKDFLDEKTEDYREPSSDTEEIEALNKCKQKTAKLYLELAPDNDVIYIKPKDEEYIQKINEQYQAQFNKGMYVDFLDRNYDLYLLYRFLFDIMSSNFDDELDDNDFYLEDIDYYHLVSDLSEIFMDIRQDLNLANLNRKHKKSEYKYMYGDLKYSKDEILALMSVLLCYDNIYDGVFYRDIIFLKHLKYYGLFEAVIKIALLGNSNNISVMIIGLNKMGEKDILKKIFKKLIEDDMLSDVVSNFIHHEN